MVYVHIPFCRTFCTYCGFYSETADCYGDFTEALLREIGLRADEIRESGGIDTVYFGGGTPSVLPLPSFLRIAGALREVAGGTAGESSSVSGDGRPQEFTVELNPDDIVRRGGRYAEALLEAGVTRASLGVQSFDDEALRWMNRRHDAAAAVEAYRILERAGFDNIGIDLIFGLPSLPVPGGDAFRPLMTLESWGETLDRAMEISVSGRGPGHLSAYQLSVEADSALERMFAGGRCREAGDELCADEYELLCARMREAGYEHYEISNFAQPGRRSRHNSAYWIHKPYVGLGPGAHSLSRLEDGRLHRRWNDSDLKGYVAALCGDFKDVPHGGETLTDGQRSLEDVMLGLRTSHGCSLGSLQSACAPAKLASAISEGLLVPSEDAAETYYRIPEKYFFTSDRVISDLLC